MTSDKCQNTIGVNQCFFDKVSTEFKHGMPHEDSISAELLYRVSLYYEGFISMCPPPDGTSLLDRNTRVPLQYIVILP